MYFDFELLQLLLGDGVRFGDDRNDVDLGIERLHRHQIQGLQPVDTIVAAPFSENSRMI